MTIKQKLIIFGIPTLWRAFRARRMFQKIKKSTEEKAFTEQFKNDWILKKAKKAAQLLKVDLEIKGWDSLPKAPALLIANHASSFDPALIILALANPQPGEDYKNINSVFLAKKELQKTKFFKGYMGVLNTFFIDRNNPRTTLKEMQAFFQYAKEEKKMAVIFPSGTRNLKGEVGEFKPGAFKFAKKEFLPIVPVTINNALAIEDLARTNKIQVEVIFGKIIKPMSLITSDTHSIAQRVHNAVSQNWKAPQDKKIKNYKYK